MAYEPTEHFVHQFGRNVDLLSQQEESRLRRAVRIIPGIVGKSASFDQVGIVAAQRKATRHGPTPLVEAPHHRRFLRLEDWEQGIALDKEDEIRMLNDPTSTYARSLAAAFGRTIDDTIVAAATATASTGETGTGTEAYDTATYQIASAAIAATTFTSAKEILDAAEKPNTDRYCLINAHQLSKLLNVTEVKSSDYNTVKALAMGELNTYCGFEIIRAERTLYSSTSTIALFWQREGLVLGIGRDSMSRISERADLGYLTQVYHCMTIGATRSAVDGVVSAILTA